MPQTGAHFVNLGSVMRCSFGGVVVNATFVDASRVQCVSPPVTGAGSLAVQLSLSGQEFYGGADYLAYVADSPLGSPHPASKGREGGGSLTVALQQPVGAALLGRGSVRCMFRVARCAAEDNSTSTAQFECESVSDGTLLTPGMARCAVPPISAAFAGTLPTRALLFLSLNGAQYSLGPANFTYFEADTSIQAVDPPLGPIDGGTRVVLRGSGFRGGSQYSCRFGGADVAVQAATLLPDGAVACVAPESATASLTQVRSYPSAADSPCGLSLRTLPVRTLPVRTLSADSRCADSLHSLCTLSLCGLSADSQVVSDS